MSLPCWFGELISSSAELCYSPGRWALPYSVTSLGKDSSYAVLSKLLSLVSTCTVMTAVNVHLLTL
jgi:hypothetical protein